jgi:carboxypeptidase Q
MSRSAAKTIVTPILALLLALWLGAYRAAPAAQPAPAPPADRAVPSDLLSDTSAPPATQPATRPADPIARIRDEGLNRSQVMQTLSYLTDVIGPRLTGSPNLRRANEWTREKMTSWGLVNAHDEAWGPFGRGWSLKRFSMQVIEPQAIVLIGHPKAWSGGFDAPFEAEVLFLDARTQADLDAVKGKLKGTVVLLGATRDIQARFEPLASRVSDTDLLKLSNAAGGSRTPPGVARSMTAAERRAAFAAGRPGRPTTGPVETGATTQPTTRATTQPARPLPPGELLAFVAAEGAAVIVTPSPQGDGGTFFIGSAAVPMPRDRDTAQGQGRRGGRGAGRRGGVGRGATTRPATRPTTAPANQPRPWALDARPIPAQVTLAAEDYNRLVRMIRQGEKLKMAVDLQVEYHTADPMAYNTVAEIPGTDLKDEIVMLGAHMDSWHAGTGATDNGAGVAAVMEAVRIIKATGLQPRRTIRVGLWTGEEQGIFGSKAYVTQHFGSYDEAVPRGDPATRPTVEGEQGGRRDPETQPAAPGTRPTTRPLTRKPEYEKLSVYFNLDNGTGKVRGVYLQGNDAARPIFRRWLAPFEDLGADTLTLSNTSGTDHLSFDAIGLPGFQFIQDPVEYWTRTHHSNEDVFDRIQADDLKQASTILAAFAWNAATMDERFPRKPSAPEATPAARPAPSTRPAQTASGEIGATR